MKTDLEPGKYVVAVSGGVDSMVLLDLLNKQKNLELVVAHFDHGIRSDAYLDKELVEEAADLYGLEFEAGEGHLGVGASEDKARKVRYEFLESAKKMHGAIAIVTAHHQDDLIETALLNLLRGTGRRGLTSLKSTNELKRPLLKFSKQQIKDYAAENNIRWREDSTNEDTIYLRNYVRKNLVSKLSPKKRQEFLELLESTKITNDQLDKETSLYLGVAQQGTIEKQDFVKLPHGVACEIMASWLRANDIREFDRKTIERLVIAAKTFRAGQRADINKQHYVTVGVTTLEISIGHGRNSAS